MVRASGCRVETADGRTLLDWTSALGAVSLGYGHPHVVEAAERGVRDGAVGPLPPALEARVAERLCGVYPGAEQVRFLKTGAEAVQAAVRIARAATGLRAVLHCGYHGWLDGPTQGVGVPPGSADLWVHLPYDDPVALEMSARGARPAAIVLEPFIERPPRPDWLKVARGVASESGAVLIFDEVKTAFRVAQGGAAQVSGVTPDLAVLGKAMSNGFPLAAVVGRADLMARVRETWISSTLATEYVSLAAADAVLDVWEQTDVAGHIAKVGKELMDGLPWRLGDLATVTGEPAMQFIRWKREEHERAFLLACAERGLLLKRGAYNFPSLAHGPAEVAETLAIVADVVKLLS